MKDILLVLQTSIKNYLVNSLSYNKHNKIVKNNWYNVDLNNLNEFKCNCVFMQKYNMDFNKVCKHIKIVQDINIDKYNKYCNIADKPFEYDYING
jgi:hypothetical protein